MKNSRKMAGFLICVFLTATFVGCNSSPQVESVEPYEPFEPAKRIEDTRDIDDYSFTVNSIVAEDDYGVITYSADGVKTDKERYVGMFYFLNLGMGADVNGTYNVTEIIKKYGIEEFGKNSTVSPAGVSHHWGQPVFGYYHSGDTWVIRKQVEMLTMAGVDFICFDTSNAVTYDDNAEKVLDIILEYHEAGWNVPKVMYHFNGGGKTNFDEGNLTSVYEKFYKPGKYDDIWFKPEGKPLTIVMEATAVRLTGDSASEKQKELGNYFHFRYAQWPTAAYNAEGFAWMDYEYPQRVYTDMTTVSVAQHVTVKFSDMAGTRGRGWNYKTGKNDHTLFGQNINFKNQWETAYKNDAQLKYVFVTGWNEWIASKQYLPNLTSDHNGYLMCDTFNDEYSRDLEPSMESSIKDNGYKDLISYIRKYKYEDAKHYIYPEITIDMEDFGEEQWLGTRAYRDFVGECSERYYLSYDRSYYNEDDSNRNDIDTIRVARDDAHLYFRITTADEITSYTSGDQKWMNIWIKTQNGGTENSLGYQYVINREIIDGVRSRVLKSKGGADYKATGEAEYKVFGKVILVKIPLSALGLSEKNYDIEFKVSDNVKATAKTDILEFYNSGDSAPIGGLSYKFGY